MKRFLIFLSALFAITGCSSSQGTSSTQSDSSSGSHTKVLTSLNASYSDDVFVGHKIEFSKLRVIARYNDNSSEDVKDFCQYLDGTGQINIFTYIFNEVGNIPIVALYENKTSEFYINVVPLLD